MFITVLAVVMHIKLFTTDAERDKAAAQPAAEEKTNDAADPGERSILVSDSCVTFFPTVSASNVVRPIWPLSIWEGRPLTFFSFR